MAPNGLAVGDVVMSGADAEIKVGNTLPLENIPVGSVVHNIEFQPGRGGKIARSAGNRDRKSTRLNSSHIATSRMPSSA